MQSNKTSCSVGFSDSEATPKLHITVNAITLPFHGLASYLSRVTVSLGAQTDTHLIPQKHLFLQACENKITGDETVVSLSGLMRVAEKTTWSGLVYGDS